MNLNDLTDKYVKLGYKRIEASSKVCQDIILDKIYNSNFKNNITIKGGVVIHNISKDIRRATRDLDLDFIRYSLDNTSIVKFINILNTVNDGITIEITGNIEKLHHQDYDGKRLNISIKDKFNNIINTKLDIGVNKYLEIEQDELFFDLTILDEEVSLLVNSKEQIFTEKLKSLLKFGIRSTRYKDIFDFCYFIKNTMLDKSKLLKCFELLIFNDKNMKENNMSDIINRITNILTNPGYKRILSLADNNWLVIPVDEAIDIVLNYLNSFIHVSV